MTDAERLLTGFYAAGADRIWIISQLADAKDEDVIRFLESIIANSHEEDVSRIEALKALRLRQNDDQPQHILLGTAVLNVLMHDEDILVRQHAAKALANYMDVKGVLDGLEGVVRDEAEDIDIRYNALSAIEKNVKLASCVESLQRLKSVPELGRSADRTLRRLCSGGTA